MKSARIDKNVIVHIMFYLLLVSLFAGLVAGLFLAHGMLSAKVREVDHLKIDNELTEKKVARAKNLAVTLSKNEDSAKRAAAIVADSKTYEYQNQIVEDLSSYASAAGLTILGFNFASDSDPTASSTKKVAGLNTVTANITLKNPVPYNNYLRFLKLIERNLTKMQVTKLDIAADLKSPGTINSPSLGVEVYVK